MDRLQGTRGGGGGGGKNMTNDTGAYVSLSSVLQVDSDRYCMFLLSPPYTWNSTIILDLRKKINYVGFDATQGIAGRDACDFYN